MSDLVSGCSIKELKVRWKAEEVSFCRNPIKFTHGAFCYPARRLLKSMSIKQGVKFDSPESAREILPFIAFHNLNVDEMRDPLESFSEANP
jgi:hypothetical protein